MEELYDNSKWCFLSSSDIDDAIPDVQDMTLADFENDEAYYDYFFNFHCADGLSFQDKITIDNPDIAEDVITEFCQQIYKHNAKSLKSYLTTKAESQ